MSSQSPPAPTTAAHAADPRLRLLDVPWDEARARLVEVLHELGEPAYRADQVLRRAHGGRVRAFDAMTELPARLRSALDERVRLSLVEPVHRSASSDETVKTLWRLADGPEIESVSIPFRDRISSCVSSQAGCALKCRFCATASLGLARNLTSGEILDQVLAMAAELPANHPRLGVVFMGMGEPGYNMDAVLAACRALNDPRGLGIGARHVTLSTAGVVPAIARLAQEPLQIRLAVSLHTADQELRASLMNVAQRHPLDELRAACVAYHDATGRRVTFEYAVMKGLNDRPGDARALAAWCEGLPSKVNLIPYNPVEGFEAPPATARDAALFRDALVAAGYRGDVMVRQTRGRDIEAACGMLHRARSSPAGNGAARRHGSSP